MRARHAGRRAVAGLAIAAAGAGAGCGTNGDPPPPASTAHRVTTAPVSAADSQAAAKSALAAYAGYLTASRDASRVGDPLHPALSKYLADPLLTRVRLTIRTAREHGAIRTGALRSDPVVTGVSLDAVPATVEIQDCLDATDYRLVYLKTKKVVPGTGGHRYLATATATRYAGRWLISAGAAHEDQPC